MRTNDYKVVMNKFRLEFISRIPAIKSVRS